MCTNRALNLVWVPSFDQLPGYPGLILIFFFKNQNDVVLVKQNKSQRVATRFLTESYPVSRVAGSPRVSTSSIFLKPGLVPTSGQPGPRSTCWAGPDFKTMLH